MIIDFHTHAFPDELAERAVTRLAKISGLKNETDGTIEDTKAKMSLWGVNKAVVFNIVTKPNQEKNVNEWAIGTRCESIVPFASIHFKSENILDKLMEIKMRGFLGIKLHPDYQGFMIDDMELFPIYDLCSDLGLVVSFHAGLDCISPDLVHAPPHLSAKVIDMFPKMKMVLAHLGGFMLWGQVLDHLAGKEVYFDTSMCAGNLDPTLMHKILGKHDINKVLFGSDCPWQSSSDNLNYILELGLSSDENDKLLANNAKVLLGI